MAETKLPRLLAAAKEFNIGQDTLIEFLVGKGFSRDDLKPTAKLSEEMYGALQAGFQSDKVAKTKADAIEIPKNVQQEKKRKEDVDISIKAKPVFKEEPKPEPQPEPKKEEPKPEPVAEKPAEPAVTKVEAPAVEAPKVVDKIDLSAIDSSTRPKKGAKKKAEPKTEEPAAEKPKKKTKKAAAAEAAAEPATPPVGEPAREEEPQIMKIEAEKLTGPKILGKIDLPVDNDTRPKQTAEGAAAAEEKRKRKRIPIEKKGEQPQRGGFQRGPGAPAGGRQGVQAGPPRGNRPTIQKGGAGAGRRDNRAQGDKEIDQKEIQDKIRETQAKLAGGGGKGKNLKSKARREKRQEAADAAEGAQDNKLQVTEFVTVSELANLMDVSFAEVISKCMSLGIMVSINQRLDAEVIELVAAEFDYEVEFIGIDDTSDIEEEDDEDDAEDLSSRAPIVTIMGHVDHGKTSLLDYIRSANVVAGEAGGLTQHIGAYEVTLPNGKHITFLDTPGHEAFTAMRARGAKVTDIAVIVVAADDAVMPQTKEAISHAQAAGVPMIFAVNKIDKDGANPQKIYEQLAGMNILVESWGGKYQSQELSAKKGMNVDLLLEKILLEAELLDLKANPNREASGNIIEASLDKGRGYVATLLVQNGTLRQGDLIVSGQHYGRVKAMFNERNQRADDAPPSTPVVILGLNGAPQAGEKFKVYEDESEAKEIATKRAQILREQGLRARKHITLDEIGRRLALGNFKELNIIIKGDVDGSVEALSDSLQKLSTDEIAVRVVHKAVGQISESDVLLATASDAIVVGFNVRPSMQASRLAETEGVQIKMYSIIYTAIDEIRSAMEGMLEPKVQEKEVANIEIREVYKFDKATVAGCYVTDGKVKRDSKIRVFRDGILIYPRQEGGYAELGSLKRFKDDVKEVAAGYECGLTVKNFADIQNGDTLVAYEEEEVKRTL
jgi:translation initiation factor IF-2